MTTLPRPRTSFVGRTRSLTRVRSLVAEHRHVTLTGVGGSGKTRLALRVAEEVGPPLADEVHWVELASLEDPGLVEVAVCSSLGVRVLPDTTPMEALSARLQTTRILLVLDNCEHLIDGCASLVLDVLERCPDLRFLATSREPLGIPGEVAWPVPALSLPEPASTPGELLSPARSSGAVQLFVQRARAVVPEFELNAGNVGSVVATCRRLEGIPLALELAAARLRHLAVQQIEARLEDGLDLLRADGRGVPPRHRTMRAALAWSHDLLSERERALFRRMAAFAGHVSVEACEAVCRGGVVEEGSALEILARLVDQSLVVVDLGSGSARYRPLEPIRQFALEQLVESGELDVVRRRHTTYYLDRVRMEAPGLRGPRRAASMTRLEQEHDDLRQAWDHTVAEGDDLAVAELVRGLFWFWNFGSHFSEARTRSENALERLGPGSEARPDLLHAAGTLAWMQGDYEVAKSRLETCVGVARRADRNDLVPLALRELAGVRLMLGDPAAAAALYEEGAALLRESDADWDLALSLVMLADAREGLNQPDAARELREEAKSLFSRAADPWGLSLAHFGLGVDAGRTGDLTSARIHAREALVLQRNGGDAWNVGQSLALLGEIEDRSGRPESAAEYLLESLQAFQKVGDRASVAQTLLSLAGVEAQRGRTLRAVRLAGAGRALSEGLGGAYPYALATESDRHELIEGLQRTAGANAFAEEWALARAMTLHEAVAFAAAGPESTSGPARIGVGHTGAREGEGATLRVLALGPPEVYRGRRRLRPADWTYALPRELLFNLLLNRPRTREQIGLDFWPDATKDQLRGRFRTTLYQLRRALGGTEWVRYEHRRYAFDRSQGLWFDVDEFESNLDAAGPLLKADPHAAATHLQQAVDAYRGDLLEGESTGAWASEHRDRLRRLYLDALLTLGGLRADEGSHGLAADLFRCALAHEELDERAHRGLARAMARSGDRMGALRHLDVLAALLEKELDVQVSLETAELRALLERGQEPDGPAHSVPP